MTKQIQFLLSKLGLNEYETKIFNSLLNLKELSAREISKNTKIPYGKIYELLENLSNYKLIEKNSNSRPALYNISNPEKSLENYYKYQQKISKQKLQNMKKSISELKPKLNENEPLQNSHSIIFDSNNNNDIYFKIYQSAETSIKILIPSYIIYWDKYQKFLNSIKPKLNQALKKNVVIEIMEPDNSLKKLLKSNQNLKIKKQNFDYGFIIIDNFSVYLDIYDPLTETTLGLVEIHDKKYCQNLIDKFEIMFNQKN